MTSIIRGLVFGGKWTIYDINSYKVLSVFYDILPPVAIMPYR